MVMLMTTMVLVVPPCGGGGGDGGGSGGDNDTGNHINGGGNGIHASGDGDVDGMVVVEVVTVLVGLDTSSDLGRRWCDGGELGRDEKGWGHREREEGGRTERGKKVFS